MIATVTKKFASLPSPDGPNIVVQGGTELALEKQNDGSYLGSLYNGPTTANVKLTERELGMWCVVRRAHDLGYR